MHDVAIWPLTKRERLSASRLCTPDEIPTLPGGLEHCLLDGEQGLDPAVVERPDGLGAQAEVGQLQGQGQVDREAQEQGR